MTFICGINPVLEALNAATRHFERLLIVKGLRNHRAAEIVSRASQMGIPLRFEPREALDRVAGGVRHQGIIAVVSPKPLTSLEALLQDAREPATLLVLDGVEDPRNLGAILRTAEAAGVDGVLLPERHTAALSETVSRSSAGGLEFVKIARIGNVAQTLESLKGQGFWVVGFDALGTERWDAVDYRRSIAFVLGGEGRGIRRLVRERCDQVVSIPLLGHVASLNVSVAAGIALYELVRQQGRAPSHVRPIPGRAVQPSLGGASVPGAESEGSPETEPDTPGELNHFDEAEWPPKPLILLEDEVSWASPTPSPRLRSDRSGRRRSGHPREAHRPRNPGTSPPSKAPDAGSGVPPGNPAGPGRRKRRRGRRGRGEPTPQNPATAGPPIAPAASVSAPPPSEGAPRRRRRRRRR